MNLGLVGKIALVTGGSSGIGKAIVGQLLEEGVTVITCGRNEKKLERLKEDMSETPCLITYSVDATEAVSVDYFCRLVSQSFPYIDILINTIGGLEKFSYRQILEEIDWLNAYKLNFMSTVNFCERFVPHLITNGGGKIVNFSSLNAKMPGKFNPHYSASKAALINYSKSLANELAPNDILVNVICPSSLTGDTFDRNAQDRSARDSILLGEARTKMLLEETKKTPLGVIGDESDAASLALFLVSEKNCYITGQAIVIDGGISRSIF